MLHLFSWIALILLLLSAASFARRSAERREARRPPLGEWIELDGRRLHLRRVGTGGPSIVIESGGGASSVMWWPLQDRLAALSTVVTYDRAGLGWSDPAPLPRTLVERADELHSLLRCAQIPPPYVLVGLSYGGPLIRLFAAQHRELVAGLVFVDIGHEAVFSEPGALKYVRLSARMFRVASVLVALGVTRVLRIRGIPTSPTALPYTEVQQRILHSRFPPAHAFRAGADEFASMQGIAGAMQGLGRPGVLGSLPVVVLSHGKPFPGPFAVLETNHLRGQQELAALSSNSGLVIATNSSHAIPLEEPQLVLDAITRVFTEVRRLQR